MDSWTLTPAFIIGRRTDVLAANRLATALNPAYTSGVNLVRSVFLEDPHQRDDVCGPELARFGAQDLPRGAAHAQPRQLREGLGPLTPYGQFALAIGTNNSAFLERCGTPRRRLLADGDTEVSRALASNSTGIVWQAVFSHLSGLFLPSLQTFTIPLLSAIVKPAGAPESPEHFDAYREPLFAALQSVGLDAGSVEVHELHSARPD
jgi:hypothetical protein